MINELLNKIFKFNVKEWDTVWLPPLTFYSLEHLQALRHYYWADEIFPIIDDSGERICGDDRVDVYTPVYKILYEHTLLRRKLNSYWFRIKMFVRRIKGIK